MHSATCAKNDEELRVVEARACTHRFEGVGVVPVVLVVVDGVKGADDEGPSRDGVGPKTQVPLAHPGGARGRHRLQPQSLLETVTTFEIVS